MNRDRQFRSNDALLELISTALQSIRQSPMLESSRPIVLSTMDVLRGHRRDDLCKRFIDDLRSVVTEGSTVREPDSVIPAVTGDNLIEENMEVDDEQEDKQKKTIPASMKANEGQSTVVQDPQHAKQRRRKSRFSDLLPSDRTDAVDRARTKMSTMPMNMVFSRVEKEQRRSILTTMPSTTNGYSPASVSGSPARVDHQ